MIMRNRVGWYFYGIIIAGILLPWLVMLIAGILISPMKLFSTLRDSSYGLTWVDSLMFFGGVTVMSVIPFIILAFLIKFQIDKLYILHPQKYYYCRIGGIIGAIVGTIGVSLFINILVCMDLFSDSPSSTGGMAYFFLPSYSLIAMFIGYWFGWLIGILLDKRKT
jgi:hypothetical protein